MSVLADAADAMLDLAAIVECLRVALRAGDEDELRRILAGPLGVVARSTLERIEAKTIAMVPGE